MHAGLFQICICTNIRTSTDALIVQLTFLFIRTHYFSLVQFFYLISVSTRKPVWLDEYELHLDQQFSNTSGFGETFFLYLLKARHSYRQNAATQLLEKELQIINICQIALKQYSQLTYLEVLKMKYCLFIHW